MHAGQTHSSGNNDKKSFDKRHISSKSGFEMIVNARKAPKEIVTMNNIANGVIASEFNNAALGTLIPKKRLNNNENTFIYNLVLKKSKSDQATYENLRKGLVLMLQHMKDNKVEKVVFPLDFDSCIIRKSLSWNAVRTLMKNVLFEENVKIIVYNESLRPSPINDKIVSKLSTTPFLDILEGKLTPISS